MADKKKKLLFNRQMRRTYRKALRWSRRIKSCLCMMRRIIPPSR